MLTFRCSALAAGLLVILFVASYVFAQTLSVNPPRGNVRSVQGTSYDIVGMVSKGEKYRVEGRAGDWFKVLLETGREGWIYKSLVDVSGRRTITVTPASAFRPPPLPSPSQGKPMTVEPVVYAAFAKSL